MSILDRLKSGTWNIGFIDQDVEFFLYSNTSYSISWMKHEYTDRFFADPFLLEEDSQYYYVLAEEYPFIEGKGLIVKLTVEKHNKRLINRTKLIETGFHLSYPFIYGEEIFVEQHEAGKWIAYDWKGNETRVLANIGLIDATIFDDGNQQWVFSTRKCADYRDAEKKLYRYRMTQGLVDLSSEMLIKDSFCASRPGGIFFQIGSDWYRSAQTSTEKVYGESLSICKILQNNEVEYREEIVKVVNSHNEKRYNLGLHTFNPYPGIIIVDGFERQYHPVMKIAHKMKYLYK